jgi:hypothetical protein
MDFRVPPGCTGLTFKDGSRVNANRDGRVVVDEKHASAIEKADPSRRIHRISYNATRAPGRECRCGFMAYRWQSSCPRCGQSLKGSE